MENENQQKQEIKPVTCYLLPITYFGPISWYSRLLRTENWRIDDTEHYVKQTTRNHCLIATANGIQKLTVPVEKPSRSEEGGARKEERASSRNHLRRFSPHGSAGGLRRSTVCADRQLSLRYFIADFLQDARQ